jgi:hypothetical protein
MAETCASARGPFRRVPPVPDAPLPDSTAKSLWRALDRCQARPARVRDARGTSPPSRAGSATECRKRARGPGPHRRRLQDRGAIGTRAATEASQDRLPEGGSPRNRTSIGPLGHSRGTRAELRRRPSPGPDSRSSWRPRSASDGLPGVGGGRPWTAPLPGPGPGGDVQRATSGPLDARSQCGQGSGVALDSPGPPFPVRGGADRHSLGSATRISPPPAGIPTR